MKLGYFTMPLHPVGKDWRQTLAEDREAVLLADRLGYEEAFIGEHVTDLAETITSCLIFIATLARDTQRIHLGSGTVNLANRHPAATAAEIAMVDTLLEGRFILGSAAPRTIVDPAFALSPTGEHVIQIGQRETVSINPAPQDLRGVADAIIGVEAWRNRAISIDYRSGLVTYQKEGLHSGAMDIFRYPAEPMIQVSVNGRDVAAIVDTTSPDTLVLPRATHGRGTANVRIGRTDFGTIDVQYANVTRARVCNRLLSRYLVTIDYGRRLVGLWRDPRIPLEPQT